jgi:hypothetical protein
MTMTSFSRLMSLVAGVLMTSVLHAAALDGPPDDPRKSPRTAWSEAPFLRFPPQITEGSLITWDEAIWLQDLAARRSTATPTLIWKSKALPPALRDEPVRHMPVFSVIEPVASSFTGGVAPAAPRWLSGSLNGPQALFFFDAPPAINVAAIQPVPEASTWVLMLAGLGVVVLVTRRRRDAADVATMTTPVAT